GFRAGWLAEASLCSIGLAIACGMVEPPACPEVTNGDQVRPNHDPPGTVGVLIGIILPAAFLGSAASATSFLAQTKGPGGPGRSSALVAIVTLAEALGSAVAMRCPAGGAFGVQVVLAGLGLVVLAV